MATIDYREYEKMSPFEIKDGLMKLAKQSAQKSAHALLNAGRGNPNWIATAPREAFFLFGQFALDRKPAHDGRSEGRSRRDAADERHSRSPGKLAREAFRHARRRFHLEDGGAWREDVRLRCRRLRARTRRLDHRRQLSGSRPHARPRRAGGPPLPDVGHGRRRPAIREVRPLCRRRRHGGHVLHLQVADREPHPQEGRHDRYGDADLHPLYRDRRTRRLRLQGRPHQSAAGESFPVHRRRAEEARGSEGQGILRRQPRQPDVDGVSTPRR